MSKTEFYIGLLLTMNLFFLWYVLVQINITNLAAVFQHNFFSGYVALVAAAVMTVFVLKSFTKFVLFVRQVDSTENNLLPVLARDTLIILGAFVLFAITDTLVAYQFNFLS